MSEKNAEQIMAYYTELAKIAPSQDWERILKTAKKILGLSVQEKKAFQTKVICLINLDKFDEALSSIERYHDANELHFEKAYCQYRLDKFTDAYDTLMKCENPSYKEKELLAQIAYRLENYQEAYDFYRDIIKNVDDDFEVERTTNLSAVVANLKTNNPEVKKDLDMTEHEDKTFELCFNSACISLSKGQYNEAQEKLVKAEQMCNETFTDPDDQDDLEREITVIRAQLAYCLQKLGESDNALKIYTNVLKTRKANISTTACISNNLVCINKDQNVFDSKKRIKAATSQELVLKLTSLQRSLIAYNEILFCIITNQNDSVQKLLKKYESGFNNKERYTLLKMSQLCKEKKFADAENLLNDLKSGACSSTVLYYLLQILLTQGKVDEAIEFIKTLDDFKSFKLGITSAVVSLFNTRNKKQDVTKLYESAIAYFSKINPDGPELITCIKENSQFQLSNGNYQGASEMLEKLRAMKPDDFKILSKLINIYSKFDGDKAKNLSKELPSLEDIIANSTIDLDTLENQFSLLTSRYAKLTKTGGVQIKSPDKVKSPENNQIHKKKKKRKIKLPKKIDPKVPIDQERWIPLKERSYYRGKRNKKKGAIGKGTQGAVSKDAPSSPAPAVAATATSPKPEKPAANKPSSKPKPKPKKKGKGGW